MSSKYAQPFVRGQYNYNPDSASEDSGLKCEDKHRTQQHQAEDTDINVIVQRFGVTGTLPQSGRIPTYGDFTGINNYQDAQAVILEANKAFHSLPAQARKFFDNDPAQFLAFMENPDGDTVAQLGLGAIIPAPPPNALA